MRYRVVRPLKFDGKRFAEGDVSEFPEKFAEQGLELGDIEPLQKKFVGGLRRIELDVSRKGEKS